MSTFWEKNRKKIGFLSVAVIVVVIGVIVGVSMMKKKKSSTASKASSAPARSSTTNSTPPSHVTISSKSNVPVQNPPPTQSSQNQPSQNQPPPPPPPPPKAIPNTYYVGVTLASALSQTGWYLGLNGLNVVPVMGINNAVPWFIDPETHILTTTIMGDEYAIPSKIWNTALELEVVSPTDLNTYATLSSDANGNNMIKSSNGGCLLSNTGNCTIYNCSPSNTIVTLTKVMAQS